MNQTTVAALAALMVFLALPTTAGAQPCALLQDSPTCKVPKDPPDYESDQCSWFSQWGCGACRSGTKTCRKNEQVVHTQTPPKYNGSNTVCCYQKNGIFGYCVTRTSCKSPNIVCNTPSYSHCSGSTPPNECGSGTFVCHNCCDPDYANPVNSWDDMPVIWYTFINKMCHDASIPCIS